MKKNQDRVSPLTKVLVGKIHGARKQDSKFWQSEFSHPRNDYVYDNCDENRTEASRKIDKHHKKSKIKYYVVRWGVVVLGGFFSIVYFLPDVYPNIPYSEIHSTVRGYFPDKVRVASTATSASSSHSTEQLKDYSDKNRENKFTVDHVEKNKNVLLKKNSDSLPVQNVFSGSNSESVDKPFYEVELFTGGSVISQNIMMTDEKVIIVNDKGLVVTMNKKDVKTIKRL